MVQMYEADELAEDSRDEKKIRKAEKVAEKEAERRVAMKKKSSRGRKRPFSYTKEFSRSGPTFSAWPDPRPALCYLMDHQATEQQGVLRLPARLDHMWQVWAPEVCMP